MSTDLEKARAAVIEAARNYVSNPFVADSWSRLFELRNALHCSALWHGELSFFLEA